MIRPDPLQPADAAPAPAQARLFLREPGWQVLVKVGSERAFCFSTAPGEDYYHRIGDGEIFLQRGDERYCLPCADRHGLLGHVPRPLRKPTLAEEVEAPEPGPGYDVRRGPIGQAD